MFFCFFFARFFYAFSVLFALFVPWYDVHNK